MNQQAYILFYKRSATSKSVLPKDSGFFEEQKDEREEIKD